MSLNQKKKKKLGKKDFTLRLRNYEFDDADILASESFDSKGLKCVPSFKNFNCHIVLNPNIDPVKFLKRIDPVVNYDDILFFIKPLLDEIKCPVCLEDPSPPVVTRCGHVYCWKCIIQCILVKSQTRNSKCPLCSHPLTTEDVRIVVWRNIQQPEINQEIKMSLCVRNSMHCYISLATDENKFISTSLNDGLFEKHPGIWFVQDEKHEEILSHVLACPQNSDCIRTFLEKLTDYTIAHKKEEPGEDDEEGYGEKSISIILNQLESFQKLLLRKSEFKVDRNMKIDQKYQVNFYQMLFGYNIYLHPKSFDQIKQQLFQEGKSKYDAPLAIKGKVVSLTHMTATPKLLQRYKFLSHLPLNTHFTFCLLELTEPFIPLIMDQVESVEEVCSEAASEDETDYYYNRSIESQITSEYGLDSLTFYLLNRLNF